jgi:ubiquinone/menaquinone biosynthesis C-methylase UbiE
MIKTDCGCKAKFNATFMKNLEWYLNVIYDEYKRNLFNKLGKNVLEIGAGTGINLKYYKSNTNLYVIEPSKPMLNYLLDKVNKGNYPLKLHIIEGYAENLPFEDESLDSVVSTLVLCSVKSPAKVLFEIKRVLKPNGVFIFLEHIKAPNGTITAKTQDILYKGWKWLFDGCDIKRETDKLIKSFFKNTDFKIVKFKSPFIPVNYHLIGYAVKDG